MSKKKRKNQQKNVRLQRVLCLFLIVLVLTFAYIMKKEKTLEPQLNEITTSYISFNNKRATDRLTITNLKVLSESIGKSKWNKSRVIIPISGEEQQEYTITIYPIHEETKEEFIEIYIHHNKEKIRKKLSELEPSSDGGKILYQGKIDHSSIAVNMWISNKNKNTDEKNSFEMKIKSR